MNFQPNFDSFRSQPPIDLPKMPTEMPKMPGSNTPSFEKLRATPSPQSRAEGQRSSRPTRADLDAVHYRPISAAATLASKCVANLVNKAGLKTFNTNADALKANEGWKERVAAQVSRLSERDQLQLASMSLYDLVDHDREVTGHILSCLSESRDLNETTRNELKSKVAELNTLVINIDEKNEDVYKYLGGGAVNKVYRVTFTNENGEQVTGVFKPDPAELGAVTQAKELFFGTAQASGIPAGDEGHLTARSVGSYALDKALYGDNPIGVKTEYIVLNGKRGILMELAKGASPEPPKMEQREITKSELWTSGVWGVLEQKGMIDKNDRPREGWTKILEQTMGASNIHVKEGKIFGTFAKFHVKKDFETQISKASPSYRTTMEVVDELGGYENLSKEDKQLISQQLKVKDFRIENGNLIAILPQTPINLEKPITAEGMLKLQVFDWISGQVDRHPGNYYIDPRSGVVLAIDNDCSFGVNSVPKNVDVRSQATLGMVVPNMGSLMLRMPTVVTESVKNEILALFNDPGKLKATLDQYVSEAEIAATSRRLEMLAKHVNSDKCKVVTNAEDLYSPQNLLLQDSNNSLYLRERDRYRSKSWNDLRK